MRSSKQKLIEIFEDIMSQGWVRSHRSNNTGIGKTFEDLANIEENNNPGPDFEEFEIKSHRENAASPITLFTMAPTFPKRANSYLKERFGEYYVEDSNLKKLHTSMFANKINTYNNKYGFRLYNDFNNEKIKIEVYDLQQNKLIDNSVYYTYDALRTKIKQKLVNLFYVSADRMFVDGIEEFKYNMATIYTKPTFEKFIELLDDGLIQYDIRIGSYQSGEKYGKPHDHGSGFRIREDYLTELYSQTENIISD